MKGDGQDRNRPPEPAGRGLVIIGLLAIIAAQATVHIAWLCTDRRIPFWDQYRYYAMTREALAILSGGSDRGPGALLDLHASHPPLYPLLGALPALLSDDGFFAARLINVALAALGTLAVFALARRLLSPRGALLASFLAGALPLAATMTHLYYIENLLALWVVLSMDAIVASAHFSRPRPTILFGVLAGTGCLVKWTYPVFLAVPAVLAAARGRRWAPLLGAGVVAAAIAGPWYANHWPGIREFFATGVTGGVGHLSEVGGGEGLLYYPKMILYSGVGLPLALAAVLGFAVLWRRDRSLAIDVGTMVVVPLVVFSLVLTKKPRHLLPLLPFLAILAAVAVTAVRRRGIAILGGLLLALHLGAATLQASFGFLGDAPELPVGRATVPLLARTHNDDPGVPDSVRWPYGPILGQLPPAPGPGNLRVLLAFNLIAFRDVGCQYEAGERGVAADFGLLPLHFPEAHPGHHPFPLDAPPLEGTLGLRDAQAVIAKGGAVWIKVQSGQPVHLDAARLGEALLDPAGPLAPAFTEGYRQVLPDGSTAAVFEARRGPEHDRWLALFALRWSPDHPRAWKALGEEAPSDATARDQRLAALGVIPESLVRARDARRRGDDAAASAAMRDTLDRAPDREDLQSAAVSLLPAADELRDRTRLKLALREEVRVPRGGQDAAVKLAVAHAAEGHRGAAVRWLRRAVEGSRAAATTARGLLIDWGLVPGREDQLLDDLRRIDRDLGGR